MRFLREDICPVCGETENLAHYFILCRIQRREKENFGSATTVSGKQGENNRKDFIWVQSQEWGGTY